MSVIFPVSARVSFTLSCISGVNFSNEKSSTLVPTIPLSKAAPNDGIVVLSSEILVSMPASDASASLIFASIAALAANPSSSKSEPSMPVPQSFSFACLKYSIALFIATSS